MLASKIFTVENGCLLQISLLHDAQGITHDTMCMYKSLQKFDDKMFYIWDVNQRFIPSKKFTIHEIVPTTQYM